MLTITAARTIRRARVAFFAAAVAALVLVVPAERGDAFPCAGVRAAAAATNRAGLIVQFGDGEVKRYCVSFTEESITGFELLRRTGLPLVYQDYGAGSLALCKIGDEGCDYPREQCFCRCRNTQTGCRFWGYYTIDRATGKWRSSEQGSGVRDVRDGDVDGWRWGTHQPNPNPPPISTIDALCAQGTKIGPAATPTAAPTRPVSRTAPSPTRAASATPKESATPTTAPSGTIPADVPSASPSSRALSPAGSGSGGAPPVGGLVAIGVTALGLGAWGAIRMRASRRAPP